MTHYLSGPAGRIEALVEDSASPRTAAVVVGHPHPLHGGTMHTKAVFHAAKAFCRLGCAVVRLNFRGVGASGGTFADGVGELDDFRVALDFAALRYPNVPLWAAGVSFGSWVAMTAGALDDRVERLVGLALPSAIYDFSTVRDSPKPKFFVHGEHDEVCPLKSVRELYARAAEPKDLVVLDGARHLFDGRLDEVGQAIEDLLG
jgi:uncharacterized protein